MDGSKRITVWVQEMPDRKNLLLQWHDPQTGRRKSKSSSTDDRKRAEQMASDLETDLNRGDYREPTKITWAAFRDKFEKEYLSGRRENTRECFKATLDAFERICSPKLLASITEQTVSSFVAGLRKQPTRGRTGCKPSTIKVRLQNLRTVLIWAVEQKLLKEEPKFPEVKVPKKKPQPVTQESFERLLALVADDAQMRAYLVCGWLGGLRLVEATKLEWEQSDKAPWIDLGRDRIVLPAEFVKSDEDQWVPLAPELRVALEALPRTRKSVFQFVGRKGLPLGASGMSDRVSALAKKAGVRMTMHTLRKGFGCRYAATQPAQVVQKLMRHSNIKTTMEYYANVDAAVEAAVFNRPGVSEHQSPQRNTSRNTPPNPPASSANDDSATHS